MPTPRTATISQTGQPLDCDTTVNFTAYCCRLLRWPLWVPQTFYLCTTERRQWPRLPQGHFVNCRCTSSARHRRLRPQLPQSQFACCRGSSSALRPTTAASAATKVLSLCARQTDKLWITEGQLRPRPPQGHFCLHKLTSLLLLPLLLLPRVLLQLCALQTLLMYNQTRTSTPTAPKSICVLQTYYFCTTER